MLAECWQPACGRTLGSMCRNIRPLNNFEPPATRDEVTAAALQYVRKVSGTTKPSQANQAVFDQAVREIARLADAGVPMTHFGIGTAELLGAMSEALGPGPSRMVGVDWRTSLADAAGRVGPGRALQGNLDPAVLMAGWDAVERRAREVVADGRAAIAAGAVGHVFNLGHGVLPTTDPGVLTDLVALVHSL